MQKFDTSDAGLREIIARGESEIVEFKCRALPDGPTAALISSFANANGGLLLIGVEENGKIVGLTPEVAKETAARLRGIAFNLVGDPIQAGVADIDGYPVVYAVIPPAPPHLRPVMTATGHAFERHGGAFRKAPRDASIPSPGPKVSIFVAMSFRDEEEPALVDYFAAMKRAANRTGLPIDLVRIDLVEGDYEISSQILTRIDSAHIVIADFTLSPQNVYLETGYARGRGKRLIQTARRDTVLEFDTRNWRTIFYANATELEERLVDALPIAYSEVVAAMD